MWAIENMLWCTEAYRGIWKNISALGLASFRVDGVTWSWRSHTLPISFAVSGEKGRSIALIEPDIYIQDWRKERFVIDMLTWFLEEPVDLVLMYVVIFSRREEAEPIYEPLRVRSWVKEIQCQEVGHRTAQTQSINVNKRSELKTYGSALFTFST